MLIATEAPEEESGGFFFALAVRAIFAPVALVLVLGMGRFIFRIISVQGRGTVQRGL